MVLPRRLAGEPKEPLFRKEGRQERGRGNGPSGAEPLRYQRTVNRCGPLREELVTAVRVHRQGFPRSILELRKLPMRENRSAELPRPLAGSIG